MSEAAMMALTEEKKKQAIISEHFLEPIKVDKLYQDPLGKGLYLTLGRRIKIKKIPDMIRRIALLTKTRAISFKIGQSHDLIYDAEYDTFFAYKIKNFSLNSSVTEYEELDDALLLAHLKLMKDYGV